MKCPDCNAEMHKTYLIEGKEGKGGMWLCNCKTPHHLVHAARQALQENDKIFKTLFLNLDETLKILESHCDYMTHEQWKSMIQEIEECGQFPFEINYTLKNEINKHLDNFTRYPKYYSCLPETYNKLREITNNLVNESITDEIEGEYYNLDDYNEAENAIDLEIEEENEEE